MNIKPKTGRRNYAKGGMVEGGEVADPLDDPNRYVQGSSGGWSPGNIGGVPGGPPDDSPSPQRTRPVEHREGLAEWMAMTPDKLYPGTEYARQWKKLSPNG